MDKIGVFKQNFIQTIINFSRNYLPLPTGESTPAAESTRQTYWSPPHHLVISTLKKQVVPSLRGTLAYLNDSLNIERHGRTLHGIIVMSRHPEL